MDMVNNAIPTTVTARPLVASMAELMEEAFAQYDGVKTMDGENIQDSTRTMLSHASAAATAIEKGDMETAQKKLVYLANRAALTYSLINIGEETIDAVAESLTKEELEVEDLVEEEDA